MTDPHIDMIRYRGIVMALPPACREVFMLHAVEELSYQAIALRLDITLHAVQMLLIEALIRIDSELEKIVKEH